MYAARQSLDADAGDRSWERVAGRKSGSAVPAHGFAVRCGGAMGPHRRTSARRDRAVASSRLGLSRASSAATVSTVPASGCLFLCSRERQFQAGFTRPGAP